MNDQHLKNIHLYLPNLTYLRLQTEQQITDKTLFSITKLNKLKTFILSGNYKFNNSITDRGVCNLITNCEQIKSIHFDCQPNITRKTIEQFIQIASNKPNVNFDFTFLCRAK